LYFWYAHYFTYLSEKFLMLTLFQLEQLMKQWQIRIAFPWGEFLGSSGSNSNNYPLPLKGLQRPAGSRWCETSHLCRLRYANGAVHVIDKHAYQAHH
jgi:hypothetical protein